MPEAIPFQLATAPLEHGITLIEASAGTGKTYSIAGLFLRLVLEKEIPIREILAVTYTVAATQELRERVRRRLHDALEDLRCGESSDEIAGKFLQGSDGTQITRGIQRLNAAVQSFDEAQIFTIHGFCQRVLRDHAFESGQRFDAELVTGAEPLLQEVARDFWRQRFYNAEPLLAALSLAWDESPKPSGLLALLNRMRNHPDAIVLPAPEPRSAEEIARELAEKFEAIRAVWKANRDEIKKLLSDEKTLSQDKSKGFPPDRLAEILGRIDETCGDFENASPECVAALTEICSERIRELTKKNKTAPAHELFELCEDFCKTVGLLFQQLRHEFLFFAREELPRRKLQANTLTYDDLLTRVRDALVSKDGAAFAESVSSQFQAALIDEFQDTDPLQYDIFHRLFAGGDHALFFIGDPKQAIYGFRGADVFTYLKASESAARFFTLETNWRSEPPLLDAMNALFAKPDAFVLKGIAHRDVHAPAQTRKEFAMLREPREKAHAPLQFRLLASDRDGGKALNKEGATDAICEAVAEDIARLHASGTELGGRPIRFSDMAVLVRKHRQAEAIQHALRARGLRSVLHTERSVFETADALELQRLLEGILEPRRDSLLKTALATGLLGLTVSEIAALDADESQRQHWLEHFTLWKERWDNECFIAMFRKFLVDENVRERLVRLRDGERRLTDLLHLAELLHDAETAHQFTPEALCHWLREQRANPRNAQESHQLRLESDDDAVLIATIHKCKGLEYPVVFCPFLWESVESRKDETVQFHDRENANRLTFDLRGKMKAPAQHRAWHSEEALAEEMRLLYVAVTRAKNRCVIYAAETGDLESSPLAHLLGAADFSSLENATKTLVAKSGESISAEVLGTQASSPVAAGNTRPTGEDACVPLAARHFAARISRVALTASFSNLTAVSAQEELDRDQTDEANELVEAETAEANPNSIFGFPRGPRAGDFFHDVLEHLDFTNPASLETLLPAKLAFHGFDEALYRDALKTKLRDLLNVELAPGLCLRTVRRAERLSEVEFSHRLPHLNAQRLRAVFAKHGGPELPPEFPEHLGALKFDPVEGFMRGFIDLLFRAADGRFYIVDWKSNWLGNRAEDYDEPAMRAAMLQHHYFLQYHLYVLATDLFLSHRLPGYDYERHFGGVFYIFLRGVERANSSRGIFRARPNRELVESLRRLVQS